MGGFGGLLEPHLTNFETRRPAMLRCRSPHRHVCIAHVPYDPQLQNGTGSELKVSTQEFLKRTRCLSQFWNAIGSKPGRFAAESIG